MTVFVWIDEREALILHDRLLGLHVVLPAYGMQVF
ncbi:hypothetical protein S101468_03322 (plasmid) [Acetobacter pasteurianus subsp. pasteurianus]|uniref:Uncharacterized protein n=1 Tax=Acetobacter pasteurianus subsp. pasteurianus TaxID=481145 RepID=A0AAC9X366_ACEPA|nr:hypothetical protein S101468_03322 [Acetobacter pasteurianus subsp. pasteurianus]